MKAEYGKQIVASVVLQLKEKLHNLQLVRQFYLSFKDLWQLAA